MTEKELERALKLRETFHGIPADKIIKVRVEREIPKVLVPHNHHRSACKEGLKENGERERGRKGEKE